MQIRKANEKDAPTLLALIQELAEFEKLAHEVKAEVKDIKETLFGPRPYAEALIADVDGQACGFALFFHNYSTFLGRPGIYLEDLYVKPEMRGQKVGFKLLQTVAQIAVERKCGRLDWSVLDWNKSAIEFYEKIGARPLSDWMVMRMSEDKLRAFAQS